jgi:tetratricopeptide (TPR) repeat protein
MSTPEEEPRPSPPAEVRKGWRFRRILLWASLPLVVLATGLGIYAYPRVFPSKERLQGRLNRQADAKIKAKDYAGAKAIYEKILTLEPDQPDARYKLALTDWAMNDKEQAVKIMTELAPIDEPGFPPAYLWLGRLALEIRPKTLQDNVNRLRTGEKYLKRVIELDPSMTGAPVEAGALLGMIYRDIAQIALDQARSARIGSVNAESAARLPESTILRKNAEVFMAEAMRQLALAEESWTAIADQRPDLLLPLATICRLEGDNDQNKLDLARGWADRALAHYRDEVSAHPENHQARIQWAAVEAFLDHFENAEMVLMDGLTKSPADPVLTKALGKLDADWYDSLLQVPGKAAVRFAILERGLKVDPASGWLTARLITLVRADGSDADKARALIVDLKKSPAASAVSCQLFGEDVWGHHLAEKKLGHVEQANKLAEESLQLWERAYSLVAKSEETDLADGIGNNLAWVLAFGPKPDLPRALELIDQSIAHQPEHLDFLHTRGFILVQLKRWKDAEADLIRVSKSPKKDRPDVHIALADIYDHMNMPDIAKVQRGYAESKFPKQAVKN